MQRRYQLIAAILVIATISFLPRTTLAGSRTKPIAPVIKEATIIASSSDQVFGYPHGTIHIPEGIAIGTVRENPAHLVLFPDPTNVQRYISTTTPGFVDLASVDYDAAHHQLYFVGSRADNAHLEVLSVDPKTLAWKPVFEFKGVSPVGFSTINTDGTFVYLATQSSLPFLLKVRISDWSLQKSRAFPDALGGFHSAAFHTYPDRSEWYVDTFSMPTEVFKINPADLSVTSTVLTYSEKVTDDVYFRPKDKKGGLLYLASEGRGGIDVVDTARMQSTHYSAPPSHGIFSDGKDLISVNPKDHEITRYPRFDLSQPVLITLPDSFKPNEWFTSAPGTTFFSVFATSSALYQYSEK